MGEVSYQSPLGVKELIIIRNVRHAVLMIMLVQRIWHGIK